MTSENTQEHKNEDEDNLCTITVNITCTGDTQQFYSNLYNFKYSHVLGLGWKNNIFLYMSFIYLVG